MARSRVLVVLVFTLGVLSGAAAAGAQSIPPPTPSTSAVASTTTVATSTTVPAGGGDLARTGPASTGLGVFGFLLLGIGVVTLVASRRLLHGELGQR